MSVAVSSARPFGVDDNSWNDLLDFIECGNVLPIVGQGITTFGSDNQLLTPWLARKLAENLGLSLEPPFESPTINDVVCRYLLNGGTQKFVYTRLHRILRDEHLEPGLTLQQLVSIDPFQLFVSTTFDSLLADALTAQFADQPVDVCAFSPIKAEKDLPARKQALPNKTVYHILGKSSQVGDYVVWEDDMMEFILGLHKHMPVMPNLSKDLADPNLHYLILGLNFSDWLVRFFLRAARQNRLSEGSRIDYIADEPLEALTNGLVMFFSSVDRRLQIIPCDPREFIAELADRWKQRPKGKLGSARLPLGAKSEEGIVFISYSHEDKDSARNLRLGLEGYGINVWLDEDRLQPATNFDQELRDTVLEKCNRFISIISRSTEAQQEAYFHKERNWAAGRAEWWSESDRGAFYIPVVVDDLSLGTIRKEPRIFDQSQRTRLINGVVTDAFAQRLLDLLKRTNGAAS